MYVGPCFEGDEDMEVAWKQHDVYSEALWIIVCACDRYTEFARSLLNDTDHLEWGTHDHFDHRTLQGAHDLLAAIWRWRTDFRQTAFPFVAKKSLDEVQALWLDWLRQEVAGWIDYPHRVRWVQLILANQNKPLGNIAETQLALDIIDCYWTVRWNQGLREAYEASLANHRKEIEAKTGSGQGNE